MSQNSHLREFCAQVSHIVFLVDLTVSRLITTVWGKLSQILYFPELIEQVSQVVFLANFNVVGLFIPYEKKNVRKLTSPWASVHKYHISCFLVDLTVSPLFTTVWRKLSQISYFPEFIEQVSQIVFLANFNVVGLFTTTKRKMSENSYLRELCAQVSQIVFLVDLTVLPLFTTVWRKL